MKTYISDIIPKFQRFSKRLDDMTLLTNQHWVLLNEIENSKKVYIFRSNGELLISTNGKVEKFKWEYLGGNSILLEYSTESYLLKQGFFDDSILALKLDGSEEFVIFINETKYGGNLNSLSKIQDFLAKKYFEPSELSTNTQKKKVLVEHKTDKGIIEIPPCISYIDQPALLYGQPAPDGKYKISFLNYIHVKDGIIVDNTLT